MPHVELFLTTKLTMTWFDPSYFFLRQACSYLTSAASGFDTVSNLTINTRIVFVITDNNWKNKLLIGSAATCVRAIVKIHPASHASGIGSI